MIPTTITCLGHGGAFADSTVGNTAYFVEHGDHPILDHLRDQFSDQASEAGCGYEPDHDHEDWNEKRFGDLFAPLEDAPTF